ncbi:hypothetical protein HYH03_016615 [Edaphochlamys debaryana]|uniref:Uncharacterized protein n=1 Tax=Edaphochlamys debaryana TaxID=47281 RepID=A0A836BQ29_9CHLO|nr:hypothetical protein HYH03_016615 [Edaphochlamys debaryana]|eukprot:KAG2484572.1 hypothetical protein HYH03_016615 [Edaphochlamys debaryana]
MQATGRALARWGLRGTLLAFASELTALPSVGVSACCALSLARSSGLATTSGKQTEDQIGKGADDIEEKQREVKALVEELKHLRKKEELLRTELQQLRKTELLLLSGAPAPRRLLDAAAELRQGPGPDVWELRYGDSCVLSYVDPMGVVDYTRGWAGAALQAAVDGYRPTAPAPLLVSGLIKTGKSYTLEHVVPAVVAEALRKAGGAHPLECMVVLRLRADTLNRQDGAAALLKNLLELLLDWVQDEHVPVRAGAVQAAMDKLALFAADYAAMGAAIMRFLKAVEVPVLVLCDEVQSLFLPTIGGKLDVSGATYIRDTLMKTLLVYGPRTVLWCLTGSSMAQTWVSLADMPPNGYAVITRACAAVLPATHSPLHMDLAWELLQARFAGVDLDLELRHLCPSSIALLTVLVTEWIDANRPKDVAAFVSEFKRAKLVEESRKEWKLGLEAMPEQQRLTVLDLSSPGVGARIDRDLHPGLRRFLEPHSKRRADGRWYLGDAHQREILRLLIKPDGTLRESWSDEEFSASLTQLDAA